MGRNAGLVRCPTCAEFSVCSSASALKLNLALIDVLPPSSLDAQSLWPHCTEMLCLGSESKIACVTEAVCAFTVDKQTISFLLVMHRSLS